MARPQEFDSQNAVDAALAVFWKRGLHRTSVENLLEASGLARSSLYNSFGGKQALFEAAVQRYVELQAAGLQTMLDSHSLEQGLRKLFYGVVNDNYEGRGCLLVNCASSITQRDAEEQPVLGQAFSRMLSVVQERIEHAQQSKEIGGDVKAADAAMLICATLSGFRVFHKAGMPKARIKKSADLAVKALMQQLG